MTKKLPEKIGEEVVEWKNGEPFTVKGLTPEQIIFSKAAVWMIQQRERIIKELLER